MGTEEILLVVTLRSTGIPSTLEQFVGASCADTEISRLRFSNSLIRICAMYFTQQKIVIIIIIIIIMKTRETIAQYHWLLGLAVPINFHLKTQCCFYLVNSQYLLLSCHRVACSTTVSSSQKLVFIWTISCLKNGIFSKRDISFKTFQVNSQCHVTSGCNAMEVVISKPKFTA